MLYDQVLLSRLKAWNYLSSPEKNFDRTSGASSFAMNKTRTTPRRVCVETGDATCARWISDGKEGVLRDNGLSARNSLRKKRLMLRTLCANSRISRTYITRTIYTIPIPPKPHKLARQRHESGMGTKAYNHSHHGHSGCQTQKRARAHLRDTRLSYCYRPWAWQQLVDKT